MEDDYLSIEEASGLSRVSPDGLAQLRYKGRGPRYLKPTPKTVLYRRSDVLAWLESTAVEPGVRTA